MTPAKVSGSPISWRSHPSDTSSSSVTDGEVRHSIPCALSAAERNSASTPGALPVIAK